MKSDVTCLDLACYIIMEIIVWATVLFKSDTLLAKHFGQNNFRWLIFRHFFSYIFRQICDKNFGHFVETLLKQIYT